MVKERLISYMSSAQYKKIYRQKPVKTLNETGAIGISGFMIF